MLMRIIAYVGENTRILTYFYYFYNMNKFYVFQQKVLDSPNEVPADNCR